MKQKERNVLQALIQALTGGIPLQRSLLWDVVTALRGPDDNNYATKEATAAVIRYYLGIPEYNRGGATVKPDSREALEIRKKLPYNHFVYHARAAFIALGLEWDEVNTGEPLFRAMGGGVNDDSGN